MCLIFAILKVIIKDICEMCHYGNDMNSHREIDISTDSSAMHCSKACIFCSYHNRSCNGRINSKIYFLKLLENLNHVKLCSQK